MISVRKCDLFSVVQTLASHIHRIREQFRAAKMSKEEAKVEDGIATIQLDWSENYHLQQAREEKGIVDFSRAQNQHEFIFFCG